MKQLAIAWYIIVAIGILNAGSAHAQDPVVSFTNAKNAFDAGEYDEAAQRFETLLGKDILNQGLIVETHKYLGVCYIFLHNLEKAEDQFVKLLNIEPGFRLDPLVFPIDVVDVFTSVQRKHALHLEKITKAKAQAALERKKAEEKRRQEEIERLRTTVYVGKNVVIRSKFVSVMPLGAGQFQNGHYKKGILFLSSQLFFAAASIVTYGLHESLREESKSPFYSTRSREKYEKLETGYRVSNRISVGALGLLMIIGIVDSIYHFEPQTITWQKIDEEEIPEKVKNKKKAVQAMVTPFFDMNTAGLGAVGFF